MPSACPGCVKLTEGNIRGQGLPLRSGVSAKLLSPLPFDSKRAHGEEKRLQKDSAFYAPSGQREFAP